MSTISEKTDELFMAATLSDDDHGYPKWSRVRAR
jgi:hypothetical protein